MVREYVVLLRWVAAGTTQKIHVPEIDVDQGREHAWTCGRFHDPGKFDEDLGTVQSPGVRADGNPTPPGGA